MKTLSYIILGFAGFLILLTIFVVPSQGGLIFSSTLFSNETSSATQYNETLPTQMMGMQMGTQASSIMIGSMMMLHILFANISVGGSWISVISEHKYHRNKEEKYDKLAKSITHFNVILFSAGSTLAFFGVAAMIGLFPSAISEIFHIFWWPIFFEAITFILEILFLYTFYYSWGKIPDRWHQFLGFGFAITIIFQTAFINMIASGMLTPGTPTIDYVGNGNLTMSLQDALAWYFNPTMAILSIHTLVAAVSYFGFLLALLSVFHFNDKKQSEYKPHWDWMTSYGMAWGLGGLIIQPITGMIYAQIIQNVQMTAFDQMMHGNQAWEFLLMASLFAVMFLIILVFYIDRQEETLSKPENAFLQKMFQIFLIITAISAFFLVQPAWFGTDYYYAPGAIINPLGYMSFKYIALILMVFIGIITLIVNNRLIKQHPEGEWGNLSKSSRVSAILTGILGMWMVVVMGFIRESGRAPWIISQIIPVSENDLNPTPIYITSIFAVWIIITMVALIVFRFASKQTTHRPGEKENY
jgi:cytochrome bd-type quinol oxidase subunit 1